MRRALVPAAIALFTLIGFFQFPGHTWLESDTQVYAPMLERLWDPSVLTRDFMATRPHMAYTIYDETAVLLRHATHLSFRGVLTLEQILFRALGLYGLFLLVRTFHLSDRMALFAVALVSLGEMVVGPSVLTVEYEPVPRGFAVPLLLLAIGLTATGRLTAAGAAIAAAFLYHPPTAFPLLVVYGCMLLWPGAQSHRKKLLLGLVPLAAAAVFLFVLARFQPEVTEHQIFFSRIPPAQEMLQRLRASYNWVSLWPAKYMGSYLLLWGISLLAYFRLRREASWIERWLLVGLPVVGLLSVPVSYVLLEHVKWSLIPEFQPARALLFVDMIALVLAAVSGIKDAADGRFVRSILWFSLVFLLPVYRLLLLAGPSDPLFARRIAIILGLAVAASAVCFLDGRGWKGAWAAAAAVAILPYWAIPAGARVENYPDLHTPELRQLSAWANTETSKDAVFLFADAGRGLDPGIFRAQAIRAVYVDWKSGGQVNHFLGLGEEWWKRWREAMAPPQDWSDLARFGRLHIDYVVLKKAHSLRDHKPAFENAGYAVYPTAAWRPQTSESSRMWCLTPECKRVKTYARPLPSLR